MDARIAIAALALLTAGCRDVTGSLPPIESAPGTASAPVIVVTPTSPSAGRAATLDSRALFGGTVERGWDFGDGSSDSGVTVSHTFLTAGDYLVSVSTADGRVASLEVTVSGPHTKPILPPN